MLPQGHRGAEAQWQTGKPGWNGAPQWVHLALPGATVAAHLARTTGSKPVRGVRGPIASVLHRGHPQGCSPSARARGPGFASWLALCSAAGCVSSSTGTPVQLFFFSGFLCFFFVLYEPRTQTFFFAFPYGPVVCSGDRFPVCRQVTLYPAFPQQPVPSPPTVVAASVPLRWPSGESPPGSILPWL